MKKNNGIEMCLFLVMGFMLIFINGCNKDDGGNSTKNETVTDIDGNVYNTVTIGTQVWMAENLKVTKYRNGDLIKTTIPSDLDLSNESTPKYQWIYGDNLGNLAKYGRLYTWFAATDSRNICPSGWHLPTDAEWTVLIKYLADNGFGFERSGSDIAKSMATTSGWTANGIAGTVGNDQSSNNKSGFSAVAGGYRPYFDVLFQNIGVNGNWWSSTESNASKALDIALNSISSSEIRFNGGINKKTGNSVRCIKN